MHHLVSAQHGTAGRAYVAALRRNDAAFYAGQFSSVRDAVCAAAGGHPQADNVALLALADALAQFYVFAPGSDWAACLEGAMLMARWALVNATGADGGDTDVKAIQFVAEWLVRNRLHFESSAEMDRLERWGSVEQYRDRPGFCWWVFSSVLDQALGGANFDRQKTLRRMADEGVLLPGSGRGFTRQKRFGDSRCTACAWTTRRWRPCSSARRRAACGGAVSRGRAMLRHGSRRPWRLVRVRVPSSRLNVLTGTRHGGTSRAGGRGRAHARAGTSVLFPSRR